MVGFRKRLATGWNVVMQTAAQAVTPLVRYASLLVLARVVSPHEMDRCAVYLTSSLVLANLCDLGMNIALLKFSGAAKTEESRLAVQRRMLFLRMCLAGAIAVCTLLLAAPAASVLLHRAEDAPVLRLAAASAFLGAISSYTLTILQSQRRFSRIAGTAAGSAVMQVATLALAFRGAVGGFWVLCLADGVGKLVVAGSNLPLLRQIVGAPRVEGEEGIWSIFRFVRWISLSTAVGAVSNYIPTLVLARSAAESSLATYLLGAGLAGWISLPVQAAMSVLLPEAMEARTHAQRAQYVRTWLPITAAIALLAVPVLWYTAPVIAILTGGRYSHSIGVFRILGIGQLVLLVANPLQFLLYSLDRPGLCFAGDLFIAAAFFVAAGARLMPMAGAEAVALALFVSQTAGKIGMVITTLRLALARPVEPAGFVPVTAGVSEA